VSAAQAEPATVEDLIATRPAEEQSPVRDFFAAHPPGAGAPVAIVIPAYNEEPTVAAVVRAIPDEMAGQPAEVIVVVDGSTDATAAQAREAGALVCDVPVNRGQGTVYWLGYWLARQRGAKVIATIDADGQYEEAELEHVVGPVLSGRADFVNGSRRLGTELTTDPVRHAGVIFFGGLVSLLIGQKITDPAAGVRAFRVEVPETVTLKQPQYQSSEMLISTALNGFRVIEVATTMKDRPVGATGTKKGPNLLYGVRFARAVLGTWRRDRKKNARTRL
jgi:glycosyltransferase involved in cell wall biosynthesis